MKQNVTAAIILIILIFSVQSVPAQTVGERPADAAIKEKTDKMYGLKENVIIGKLIPAGTGFSAYKAVELVPFMLGGSSAPVNEEVASS